MSGDLGGTNKAAMFVRLDPEADTDAVVASLRKTDRAARGGRREGHDHQPGRSGYHRLARGHRHRRNLADIRTASDRVAAAIKGVGGLENVTSNLGVSRPQIVVNVNQAKAAKYGLNAAMVAGTVRGLVAEQKAGTVKLDGQATDVMYSARAEREGPRGEAQEPQAHHAARQAIPVTSVASVVETGSPVAVLTRDGEQYATVSGHIAHARFGFGHLGGQEGARRGQAAGGRHGRGLGPGAR